MNPDLEADIEALRRAASGVAAAGERVTAAAADEPSSPQIPRWATVDAARLAGEAARQQLVMIGVEIEETARRITAVAEAYDLADARAVTRLRLTR